MKKKNKIWSCSFIIMGVFLMVSNSCTKKDENNNSTPTIQMPVLTTSAVSNIEHSTAISGGSITSDGGSTVTARGVCYSTSQNPTTANSSTSNGTGTGVFTSSITGLSASTLYYVRAYATNSAGTAYGTQISFTTQAVSCPSTVTDSRDGKTYNVIQIGNQCWMKENLNYTPVSGNSWCYDNNTTNCNTYGRLYDWATAMNGATSSTANPSGVQGICPTGWHVPSDAEWTQLTDYLGDTSVAGGKMKEAGTSHWNSPNTGADNSGGFSALPGGGCDGAAFGGIGYGGYWWSSTEGGAASAWLWSLYYNVADVSRGHGGKSYGFSVRCLRD